MRRTRAMHGPMDDILLKIDALRRSVEA